MGKNVPNASGNLMVRTGIAWASCWVCLVLAEAAWPAISTVTTALMKTTKRVLTAAFGKSAGDPVYILDADFDGDGRVTFPDY